MASFVRLIQILESFSVLKASAILLIQSVILIDPIDNAYGYRLRPVAYAQLSHPKSVCGPCKPSLAYGYRLRPVAYAQLSHPKSVCDSF